jgi:lipid A disaccharide synthetase
LLGRKVVPELIQNELTPEGLLGLTLEDLAPQKKAFQEVASKLGGPGAAERLAQHLFQVVG